MSRRFDTNHQTAQPAAVGLRTTLRHALALNADFYDDAHQYPNNRKLALAIVLLAAVSQAVGSMVISLINRAGLPALVLTGLISGLAIVAGYYLWTLAIWQIGQWLKPTDPTYADLLSPIGLAYAPQTLNFLTLIPLLGHPIQLILAVWSLLAAVVAVREGLDIRTRRATAICLLGWLPLQIAIGTVQVLLQRVH